MRYLLALVGLVACSGRPAERPTGMQDSATPPITRREAMVTATATTRLDTLQLDSTRTSTLDSVRVGDTVSYKRGYTVAKMLGTLRTVIDSQWVVLPPVTLGLPVGLFHQPVDSLCNKDLGYSAVAFTVDPAKLTSNIAKARGCKGKIVLLVPRGKSIVGGVISTAGMTAAIKSWDSVAVAKALADSLVVAVNVADDILAMDWGASVPIKTRLQRFDSAGLAVRKRWPTMPVSIRARASQIQGFPFRGITVLWWQYNGTFRDGQPATFAKAVVDSSAKLGMKVMLGLNLLDGGCGPLSAQPTTQSRRCPFGIVGSTAPGSWGKSDSAAVVNHRFEMSGAEVAYYGAVFAAVPENCASINWQWSFALYPQLNSPRWTRVRQYHADPAVRAAGKTVGVVARARPTTSCRS